MHVQLSLTPGEKLATRDCLGGEIKSANSDASASAAAGSVEEENADW